MSFTKIIPLTIGKTYINKTIYDYPNPTFNIYYDRNPENLCQLTKEEAGNNICYAIIGHNPETNQWDAYFGETGGTFKDRYKTTHKNTNWFKQLNPNTLLCLVVSVPREENTDFRQALEYQLSIDAVTAGLNVLNAKGNQETINNKAIENRPKLETVSTIVIQFLKKERNIPDPPEENLLSNSIIEIHPTESSRKSTTQYPVGTELTYSHTKFGIVSKVEATVVENNKVVMTEITNAPLETKYTPVGKTQLKGTLLKFYTQIISEATTTGDFYSWSGTTEPISLTVPLTLINGIGSKNLWQTKTNQN